MSTRLRLLAAAGIAALVLALPAESRAEDANSSATTDQGFFASWFAMATRTQDEQPHWMTPLVTVTPRLEQEFRYDQFIEDLPHNTGNLYNFGGGKGLEIIPSERTEIILGVPPFEQRTTPGKPDINAFGDWPAFLFKYRFLSANEQNGNYILTGFLQLSAPTGAAAFTSNAYIFTPTIAAGKGWGDFDVQMTLGQQYTLGTNTAQTKLGNPVVYNIAAQYHLWDIFWPELEANYTWFPDGAKEGKNQVFITPGIIFGRFPIYERVKLIVGAGYQVALTPHTPTFSNNLVFTVRTTF